MNLSRSLVAWACAASASVLMVGCGSTSVNRAPVEDRGTSAGSSTSAPSSSGTSAIDPKTLPGYENMGKPGYYTVKPGDTLIRIGLEYGQSWKDIARWSNLENANVIEVGQVLRVVPPGQTPSTTTTTAATETRPVGASPAASAAKQPASAASTASAAATPVPAPAPVSVPAPSAGGDDLNFMWPASGGLIAGFDEARNKGYDISGKAGDPVMAAADGRVVYAGAGLRGYGNLIILKHNNTFLTAYAHNQTLLVKEDQNVRKGQKIAEMGSTDTDRVKLHFEIRRQGKPVDPSRYLPSR
ncbi:peptidoglycan DD-metalloendopeptidase family protein [Diaphorobacter aerolatus]|uniref:Peptidoglycan DD-metalloendopeptidase family protein n=1 Tax=Diaphorobacter aerolatus TaxID=1288495 RepID=A0A7H0GIK8_9BURK|nr:peptidoglycan DD-metalloendopeptidase family protein [Diaphorobacter aerolatus]QNP48124.1 peptidoglycan DD-metalloendopeptidase family protein [Diaphorobacter aerolatus]